MHWRYGLDGGESKTLQEIANIVHVTREWVRQVERKALQRLYIGQGRSAVAAFREAEQEGQWLVLAGAESWLPEHKLSERKNRLDPLFLLALDASRDELRAWLDRFAVRGADGWSRHSLDAARIFSAAEAIERIAHERPTPFPLSGLRPKLGEGLDLLIDADFAGNNWSLFEGYVCTGYAGPRMKRRVRLHVVARDIAASGLFDIGTLIRVYRDRFPGDDSGSRVIQKEMDEAPHLFVRLFDGVWLVLSKSIDEPFLLQPPIEQGFVKADEFSEDLTGARVSEFLEQSGPQRLSSIVRKVADYGNISSTSIGPTLLMAPCFRRVAPGFFGLYRGEQELKERLRGDLLNESQCRFYCLARHAGAPAQFYPAWGLEFEMDLMQWAAREAVPIDLFRSLLTVIEPNTWPIPSHVVAEMESVRNREGRWCLGSGRRTTLGRRFLDRGMFLPLLAYLAIFGNIGWCIVNRLSGTRLDKSDAADVLAFLIVTGLVEPQDDWQASHKATSLATDVFSRAATQWFESGQLAWDDAVLGPLMEKLRGPLKDLGWVKAEEVSLAINAWCSGMLSSGRAFDGAEDNLPDVEETFESSEWGGLFGTDT